MEDKRVSKEKIRIVGFMAPLSSNMEENFSVVPGVWEQASSEGKIEQLFAMNDGEIKGLLGVTSYADTDHMRYYLAVASNQPLQEGLSEFEIPAAEWAVFKGDGPMPNAIQELEKKIGDEWLPASGYDSTFGVDMEVYLNPNPQNSSFEVWIPMIKK